MSPANQKRSLGGDNQGAIMVIGIFMACAMIGLTWEFIGLGDAMIWRDRSQEASDAAAFSSAAVQGRAMNLIAFLNMVLLLMTVLYLAMAFVFNLLDLILVITGRSNKRIWGWPWPAPKQCKWHTGEVDLIGTALAAFGVPTEPIIAVASYFCTIAGIVQPIHSNLKTLITKYRDNVMVPVMPKIGEAQKIIAIAAPYAGAVTASVMAYKYEDWGTARLGTALSGTMIPAAIVPNKNKWTYDGKEYDVKDERLGLPVKTEKMNELCTIAGAELAALAKDKIGIPLVGDVVAMIVNLLAGQFKKSYCVTGAKGMFPGFEDAIYWAFLGVGPKKDISPYNGFPSGFWDDPEKYPGPKHMVPYAENGNDWMQVWGTVYAGNREERAQKKVSVNGFNWDKQNVTQNGFAMYVSEAEFYFDCDGKWEDAQCNYKELAMYRLNWRARMRRVNTVNWASDLFGYYSGTAFGDGFTSLVTNFVKDTGAFKSVVSAIKPLFGSYGEKYGDTVAEKAVENGWKKLKSYGDGKVKGMLGFDTLVPTMIH